MPTIIKDVPAVDGSGVTRTTTTTNTTTVFISTADYKALDTRNQQKIIADQKIATDSAAVVAQLDQNTPPPPPPDPDPTP